MVGKGLIWFPVHSSLLCFLAEQRGGGPEPHYSNFTNNGIKNSLVCLICFNLTEHSPSRHTITNTYIAYLLFRVRPVHSVISVCWFSINLTFKQVTWLKHRLRATVWGGGVLYCVGSNTCLNTITNRERMADVGNPATSAVEDCTELAELGNGLEPGISSNAATTPTFFYPRRWQSGWVDVAIYKLRACNSDASFV